MMKLSSVFLGAAMVWGGMTAPGVYHAVQNAPETVRAEVTGVVEVERANGTSAYEVHTTAGTFNTWKNLDGTPIVKGLTYDFNLQGADVTFWPPDYTRNITDVHLVTRFDNLFRPRG